MSVEQNNFIINNNLGALSINKNIIGRISLSIAKATLNCEINKFFYEQKDNISFFKFFINNKNINLINMDKTCKRISKKIYQSIGIQTPNVSIIVE